MQDRKEIKKTSENKSTANQFLCFYQYYCANRHFFPILAEEHFYGEYLTYLLLKMHTFYIPNFVEGMYTYPCM